MRGHSICCVTINLDMIQNQQSPQAQEKKSRAFAINVGLFAGCTILGTTLFTLLSRSAGANGDLSGVIMVFAMLVSLVHAPILLFSSTFVRFPPRKKQMTLAGLLILLVGVGVCAAILTEGFGLF